MQSQQTKVLKWAKAYDLGDLYDIVALSGYVVAAVEGGMHGVRLNLVSSPPFDSDIQLDSNADDGT